MTYKALDIEAVHTKSLALLYNAGIEVKQLPLLVNHLLTHADLYYKSGSLDNILELLENAQSILEMYLQQEEHKGDVVLLSSLINTNLTFYQYKVFETEMQNFFQQNERKQALDKLGSILTESSNTLNSISQTFTPETLSARGGDNNNFRLLSLRLRHLQLLHNAALAATEGEWPTHHTKDWLKLSDDYLAAHDRPNAGIVLSNALERILSISRRVSPGELSYKKDLSDLATLRGNLLWESPTPEALRFLQELKILIESCIFLGRRDEATSWFQLGLGYLDTELSACGDDESRSVFLIDGDDWLGWAILLENNIREPIGPLFSSAHKILRQAEVPELAVDTKKTVIRAYITRQASLIVVSHGNETSTLRRAIPAQALFQSLDNLKKSARDDIATFYSKRVAPTLEESWPEALRDLQQRLGLDDFLKRSSAITKHDVLVETEGAGLELPWTGLVIDAGYKPRAVVVRRLFDENAYRSPLPPGDTKPLIINGFSKDDQPLYGLMNRMRAIVDGDVVHALDPESFRDALVAGPRSLIVIGCHGQQSRITKELILTLGQEKIAASELWRNLRLPAASHVICFNCYGGGGDVLSNGEHGSHAQLALFSGASSVIASRWPAWYNPSSFQPFRELLEDPALRDPNANCWKISTTLMTFIGKIRPSGVRHWSSWSLYSTQLWMDF